ncbi:hypothetical protein [Streptomyces collinus]|uniref:hypothetical protein n=1 Tax=Streptomyces collinus TaxID=42684 RepID=UPI0033FECAB8
MLEPGLPFAVIAWKCSKPFTTDARRDPRLSRLIDQIYQGSPGVTIVVGTLTPSRNATYQQRIDAHNKSITTMLDERVANGDRLVRVDLSAVTTADLADEVHPTDAPATEPSTPG